MPEFKKHKVLTVPNALPANADGMYVVKAGASPAGNRAILYVTDSNGIPHYIWPGNGGTQASEVILDPANNFTATDTMGALEELRLNQITPAERTKLGSLVTGYKGPFNVLADLLAAHPFGVNGDWAIVRNPVGPAQHYSWDSNSNTWEAVDFAAITGTTNLAYVDITNGGGTITSDTGTDAVIPLADSLTKGLLHPTKHNYWDVKAALADTNATAIADINSRGYRATASANVNVYVRVDGNDTNSGLTNTAAGAFLTLQAAVDYLGGLDLKTFSATVHVGDGTYEGVSLPKLLTTGTGSIVGNTASPNLVNISGTNIAAITGINAGVWYISGVTVSSGPLQGLASDGPTRFNVSSTWYGTCGHAHISAASGGVINISGTYSIVGNAAFHYLVTNYGFIDATSVTITVAGGLSISYFARAESGRMNVYFQSYTENVPTVAGTKYLGTLVGIIHAAGAAGSLPGSIAGSIDSSSVLG